MQGVGEVAAIPRCLPLDVSQKPPKKPRAAEGDLRAALPPASCKAEDSPSPEDTSPELFEHIGPKCWGEPTPCHEFGIPLPCASHLPYPTSLIFPGTHLPVLSSSSLEHGCPRPALSTAAAMSPLLWVC